MERIYFSSPAHKKRKCCSISENSQVGTYKPGTAIKLERQRQYFELHVVGVLFLFFGVFFF